MPSPYTIVQVSPDEPLPMHLLLLGDENPQLIEVYRPLSQVYLLRSEGQVLGICLVQLRPPVAEVMNIAVEPLHQGRGLGKALLRYAFDAARQQGIQKMLIKTGNSGIGQIALYQQEGFDLVQVNFNYFLETYPHPIWENNIQCKHQLVFERTL